MRSITIISALLLLLCGCEKSESTNNVVPTAEFSFSKEGSFPIIASFTSTSTGANPIVSHSWNFGDPASGVNNTSALMNPVHEYNTEGVYSVMLTTTDNMGQQDMVTVAVGASLRVDMSETNDASFSYTLAPSYPYVVTFTNSSTNSSSNSWYFG